MKIDLRNKNPFLGESYIILAECYAMKKHYNLSKHFLGLGKQCILNIYTDPRTPMIAKSFMDIADILELQEETKFSYVLNVLRVLDPELSYK